MVETAGPGCSFVITQELALELQALAKLKNNELIDHIWLICHTIH